MKPFVVRPTFTGREIGLVEGTVRDGTFSAFEGGSRVGAFQKAFAKYACAPYAIATNSGTSALHAALIAAGIKQGDEIIVPAYTFVATASAVVQCGAKPVYADIEPGSYGIDPCSAAEKISKKTKAIIPVHIFGMPCDMKAILALAKKHRLKIIEDACQAHGSLYEGRHAGTLGDAGCFSFQQTKNMTCGEGGMIITRSAKIADAAKLLRQNGKVSWSIHKCLGFNYRMTEFQAALGLGQLERLDKMNMQRSRNVMLYRKLLSPLPLEFPVPVKNSMPAFPKLPLLLPETFVRRKKQFLKKARAYGVPIEGGYPCLLHTLPFVSTKSQARTQFPIAENFIRRVITLSPAPCFDGKDIAEICRRVKKAWEEVFK